jgi:hypothetical protein
MAPTLIFPFWIVTQRRGLFTKPVELDGMPGFVAAFTAAERAATFMVSRGETEWENRLVSRSSLADLVRDLRQLGIKGVCLDPTAEGSTATIPLEELEGPRSRPSDT